MKNERMKENLTRLMKKLIMIASCLCLLPLAGCAAESEEAQFEAFRASLEDASVTVTADVQARDGDEVTSFTLRCAEADSGCELEVLAPEQIAGVRAHVDADAVEMRFDDVILPMPQAQNTVSPLMALPLVLDAARNGHLDLVWREDGLVCQLIPDDETAVRLYLDDQQTPVAAEIDTDGQTNVFCTITGWSTEKSDLHESNDPNLGGDPP